MNNTKRIGIIDIGSNSIRLVIYESNRYGAYRVIDEAKQSARLSEHLDENDEFPDRIIDSVCDGLRHFRMLCHAADANAIHAVATAAIRNARHPEAIVDRLSRETGLDIRILSGEDEARLGFLGLMQTMDATDGFLIDIGGGSTELSLFLNRTMIHTVSFPHGAVSLAKAFGTNGDLHPDGQSAIRALLEKAAAKHRWINRYPDLPMFGLGGTVRALSAIDMQRKKYSLPITHNYRMSGQDIDALIGMIQSVPLSERKNIEGLSRQRADIILPGAVALQTLFRVCGSSVCQVSASGLRDGLFFEQTGNLAPDADEVLERSVRNLLHLHPIVSVPHVEQVNRLALELFDALQPEQRESRTRKMAHAAAMLYRIGISIHFYDYDVHTFYLIAHSRLVGLTHREVLLCALIASYMNKKKARQRMAGHADMLEKDDLTLIARLGSLLQLAIALDRSETQPVKQLKAAVKGRELRLEIEAKDQLLIETRQVQLLANDFYKVWKLHPVMNVNGSRITF